MDHSQTPPEDRLARFFELSLGLLCTADATGGSNTFQDLNPAWETVLGWTREELRSRPFTDFIHPDDLAPTYAIIGDMVERGLPAVNFENRYLHKDGSWVWLSWVGSVREETFYSAARDVSETRRMVLELRRANEELAQFAYAASHDLQEPLRAITGHLGFVDDTGLDERSRASLGFVREGAEHMQQIIAGLLEYSRLGSGEISREPQSLTEIVDVACRMLGPVIERSGAVINVPRDLPDVCMDRVQGVRIFQNVLGNALKFGKPGSRRRFACGLPARPGAASSRWETTASGWSRTVRTAPSRSSSDCTLDRSTRGSAWGWRWSTAWSSATAVRSLSPEPPTRAPW